MDGSEFSKFMPSLNVLAPTSQLAAARIRINRTARSESNLQDCQPTVGSETAKTVSPNRSALSIGNARSAFELDWATDLSSIESEENGQAPLLAAVTGGLPSWMVSLTVHLALLLILAISSFGIGSSNRRLELEFVDSPALLDSIFTEIEFDDVVIEDEQEFLDPNPTQSLVAQAVEIPLGMMEVFMAENEADSTAELGILSGLPGSHTAQSGKQGKSAKFFGTKSYGSRFVFVIDCSHSMKGSRWYHAVKELNSAIEELEDDQEFLVLLYNTKASVMMNTRTDSARLVTATREFKDRSRNWLRKQRPKGGTFPASSMFIALNLNPDAIYLLSDGELQDNTRGLLQFWNTEQPDPDGTYSKIPIHTVSLGRQGQGQQMMRKIAQENDGDFTWIH